VSVTLMMDADAAREYCAAQAAQALGAAWLQALEAVAIGSLRARPRRDRT
jgi:hypothetical protein